MRSSSSLFGAALLAGSAAVAQAQPAPDVTVQLGPAVERRAAELGRSELDGQVDYLRHGVMSAIARSASPPAQVRLVIEDVEPNRPTAAELGASAGLRQAGLGLGGAAVTGEVMTRDGRRLPVRYRFFQDQILAETNFTTWGDADDAFDQVARGIGEGRPPSQTGAWPAPHPPRILTGTRIPE
jgi:hypothetical protein